MCLLGITLLGWIRASEYAHHRTLDQFAYKVEGASRAIGKRMQEYQQVLRGGIGLFEASDEVTRQDWHDFVATLELDTYWPGVQGIGFAQWVDAGEAAQLEQRVREDGFPDFSINPPGERDNYSVIVFLEPFDWRNQRAFGYDMLSESVRREAMELARDTGKPAVSGGVTLVQEDGHDVQTGFLMYMPLYRRDMPVETVAQRRQALSGFVYAPFRTDDLMQGILGHEERRLDFHIYDGAADPAHLLYKTHANGIPALHSTYTKEHRIELPGRSWTVFFESRSTFESEVKSSLPLIIGLGGVVLDLLLFMILMSLAGQRKKVADQVALMRVELQRSEARYHSVLKRIKEVIFQIDVRGRWEFLNVSWEEVTGYTVAECLGRPMIDFVHPDDRESLRRLFGLEGGCELSRRGEIRFEHRDGGYRWQELNVALIVNDASNSSVGAFGSMMDITARKHYEGKIGELNESLEERVKERTADLNRKKAELREALSLNERLLMFSSLGMATYRMDGQCVMANTSLGTITGGGREKLLQQNFLELRSWKEAGLTAAAKQVLKDGRSQVVETRLNTSFGRKVYVHCQLLRFESKGHPHLLMMMTDETERRRAVEELAERERSFRTLAENLPDNIYRTDCQGRILYLNPTLERTFGVTAAELIGKTLTEVFVTGEFRDIHRTVCRVAKTGKEETIEHIWQAQDGEMRVTALRIVAEFDSHGTPVSTLVVGHDLTEQKNAEERLRLAASVFHNSSEGVLVTDTEGTILSVNPAFTEITGYSAQEALGRKPNLLRSNQQDDDFYRDMWHALLTQGMWADEIWNRRKDGEIYLEWLTINRIDDAFGEPHRYVGVFHDITELRRKDERIRHLAFHDALSGLPNRTLLLDRLGHAVEVARREDQKVCVMFMDLDNFKRINDSLGHDIGDLMLMETARRIENVLRRVDTAARMGGDEFVVVLEDQQDPNRCAHVAEKILAEIRQPMLLRDHSVLVSGSLGIAMFPDDGDDPLALMKHADAAMYAAKSAGRNTYRFFQQQMLDQATARLRLEMALRDAISNNELELHYQPKIDLSTGMPSGAEALVRWRHPVQGLVPPSEFIPVAEECGLIGELGRWVLNEACRQAADWQTKHLGQISIAVNVSAVQLEDDDLDLQIAALTAAHGISPTQIELELTESVIMANPEQVIDLLNRLRKLGTRLAIDDFGTGYSSLAYLRRLPIDVVKIDRSFVSDLEVNEEDAHIVKIILALSQTLGLSTVAEGVETAEQVERLHALGCDLVQGFFFSKPLPAKDLEHWCEAFLVKSRARDRLASL